MSEQPAKETDTHTPFQRFEEMTRRLLTVPKRELDEKLQSEKQQKATEKRGKKSKNQGRKST